MLRLFFQLLWPGSHEITCSEGDFIRAVLSKKGRKKAVRVTRISPAKHPTLRIKTKGIVGTVYPSERLFEEIGDTFGGGIYEIRMPWSKGKELVSQLEIAGEPLVDEDDLDDARDAETRKKRKHHLDNIGDELTARIVDRGLQALEAPAPAASTDWKAIASMASQFMANLMQRPAIQNLSQDQQKMLIELCRSVTQAFSDSQPSTWIVGQILPKLDAQFQQLAVTVAPDLVQGWLVQNIQIASPPNLSAQAQANFCNYVLEAFVDLQNRIRTAA